MSRGAPDIGAERKPRMAADNTIAGRIIRRFSGKKYAEMNTTEYFYDTPVAIICQGRKENTAARQHTQQR